MVAKGVCGAEKLVAVTDESELIEEPGAMVEGLRKSCDASNYALCALRAISSMH